MAAAITELPHDREYVRTIISASIFANKRLKQRFSSKKI